MGGGLEISRVTAIKRESRLRPTGGNNLKTKFYKEKAKTNGKSVIHHS